MLVRAIMSAHNASDAFDLRCEVREKLIDYILTEAPESLPKFPLENDKKWLCRCKATLKTINTTQLNVGKHQPAVDWRAKTAIS